jgi:hypothetical protein
VAILGVDPGVEGGLAVLWDDGIMIEPMMPVEELARWLGYWSKEITFAAVEEPGMRPGQATQTTMKVGRGVGRIEGILHALGIRFAIVRPQSWSKEFPHWVTETDRDKRYAAIKQSRKEIVAKLWPKVDFRASERSQKAHAGMVDAALIAEYQRRQIERGLHGESEEEVREGEEVRRASK